jgi:hypothetical protein
VAIGDCNGNPVVILASALVLAAVMQKRTKEIRHYYSKRAYGVKSAKQSTSAKETSCCAFRRTTCLLPSVQDSGAHGSNEMLSLQRVHGRTPPPRYRYSCMSPPPSALHAYPRSPCRSLLRQRAAHPSHCRQTRCWRARHRFHCSCRNRPPQSTSQVSVSSGPCQRPSEQHMPARHRPPFTIRPQPFPLTSPARLCFLPCVLVEWTYF